MPGKRDVSRSSVAPPGEPLKESGGPTAYDALFRRHRSAVFSYALACCCDTRSAEALTSEAFTRTVQAQRGGDGPMLAWRPHLLVSVRRAAAEWAATSRRDELSPDFLQWYEQTVAGTDSDGDR